MANHVDIKGRNLGNTADGVIALAVGRQNASTKNALTVGSFD